METLHTIILIIHVLGATLIVGSAFVTLLIESKHYYSEQMVKLLEQMWKIVGGVLGLQLLTGMYLAGSEWNSIGKLSYFWIKMLLFFVVGGTVGVMSHRRFAQIQASHGKHISSGTSWAWVGFLTFALIATLGVLIAESQA